MNGNINKYISQAIQLVTVILTLSLLVHQVGIDTAIDFISEGIVNYIVFGVIVMSLVIAIPLFIYILQNAVISITRIIFSKRKKMKLRSISFIPVFYDIFQKDYSLRCSITNILHNKTILDIEDIIKESDEYDRIYRNIIIPFYNISIIGILASNLLVIPLFYFRIYWLIPALVGLNLYWFFHNLIDDNIFFYPLIRRKKGDNYELGIFRTYLNYCKISNFDKTIMYKLLFDIELPDLKHTLFSHKQLFNQELVVEAIIDSILDNCQYIDSNDYKKYLNKKDCNYNFKILKYFAIMKLIEEDVASFEVIIEEMGIQQHRLDVEHPINSDNLKRYMSEFDGSIEEWIRELESGVIKTVQDERKNEFLIFYAFSNKRTEIYQLFSNAFRNIKDVDSSHFGRQKS